MPGILPMKLIKCGTSQTRIAQACDRCRSKKIRCDGVRPCCSQCANVGFECKTSDKLSRRAFPRGYTESLEERVRQLEAEVRELKDLLDAKDEQLDMLSRIHSFSPYSPPPSGTSGTSHRAKGNAGVHTPSSSGDEGYNDGFMIQESTRLLSDGASPFYLGASSGLPFLDFFKQKLRDTGRLSQNIDLGSFFHSRTIVSLRPSQNIALKAPSRLASDHLVTSFFQEYHPLFPVLHRPTFLTRYEKLVSSSDSSPLESESLLNHDIAQLFLVFALVSQSSEESQNKREIESYDVQWQQALDTILLQNSVETIQCLVLAQLYCLAQGDYSRLVHYRSLAVGMALRMGMNRSQKKLALLPLTGEMRKRVFWCVYCLDSFSAGALGLPRLLNDEDVATEYPSDIDDEYITAKGFQSVLPGDFTKISSALALFRCSRVLGNVLDSIYHTTLTGEQTYRKLKELEEELDTWHSNLAPHLRLQFVNGAPSTNVVHSRSPLLVMAYHFTRVLIHRPVMGSGLPSTRTSASFLAMVESSKCIIQIIQLLSERRLGFSFCLNRNQLLVMSGFSILFGAVNYQQKGSLAKESEKLTSAVVHELMASGYERVDNFRSIAECVVTIEKSVTKTPRPSSTKRTSESESYAATVHAISPLSSPDEQSSLRRRMSTISAKINSHRKDLIGVGLRRSNSQDVSKIGAQNGVNGTNSRYQGHHSQSSLTRRNTLAAPPRRIHSSSGRHATHSGSTTNLDFLNWTFDSASTPSLTYPKGRGDEWEQLLAVMDASSGANIYGGGENSVLTSNPPTSAHSEFGGWGLDNYLASQVYQIQPQHVRHSSTNISTSHVNTSPTTIHTTTDLNSPYRGTAPSVSSFSSLSDEALSSEEGGLIGGRANTELDLGISLDPTVYDGEDDLGGLLAAHHHQPQQTSRYATTPSMVREELWGL